MASAGASLAASAGAFAGIPIIGWSVAIGAALFDSFVLQPALQGKRRGAARAPRLLDVPVGSNEAGAPRVWAIGRRVRVPTHILWQAAKRRETTTGSRKAGTEVNQRKVFFDALLSLNDRPTFRLSQLAGNGKLLLFRTRNVVSVESATMVVSVGGGRVIITAESTLDPDFIDKLRTGNAVELSGFVMSTGADLNTGYWKVAAVVPHTSTPSRVELAPYSGQTVTGIAATSGNAFAPATVTRVDDVLFVEGSASQVPPNPLTPTTGNWIQVTTSGTQPADRVFEIGDQVRLQGFSGAVGDLLLRVIAILPGEVLRLRPFGQFSGLATYTTGGATNPGRVVFDDPKPFAAGFFPVDFDPDLYYQDGRESQVANSLLVEGKDLANSPAYRGVACQGLDDFFVSQFGDQLPFSLEAVIDPDQVMDWATALATILRDRAGIPDSAIDVTGVDPVPFLGFFLRGPVEAATALQPLLIAKQIVSQERDGTIALSQIDNADLVRIENGPEFSHMAARLDGEEPLDDKVQIEDAAIEDLPTSIGVRHQDPDNQYADGYQQFGLRNPEGVDHENRQELDLGNLVLSRKDARNLAATTLRRAYINRRTFRITLTAHYLHLLESDLVTWTDDDGAEFTARIIQRDIGSDFRVAITAVEESVGLAISGSPVQSAAGDPPPKLRSASTLLRVVVIDAPGVDNADVQVPQIALAVCAEPGSAWPGAQVWESLDDEANWAVVGSISRQASIGTVIEAIDAEPSAEAVGSPEPALSTNPIRVEFSSYGDHPLSPAVDDAAKSGANWFVIVHQDGSQEIASWTTADFIEGTTWDLTSSYRGLRGTRAVASDAATVVRLTPHGDAGIFRRQFQGAISTKTLHYRVVPFGSSFDDAESIVVNAQWRNALPLPVRQVTRTTDEATLDVRFAIASHWSRQVLPIGAQPPHIMDEATEQYQCDFFLKESGAVSRTKFLRTTAGLLRDRWVEYPADEQIADGYVPDPLTEIPIRVRQIGEFGTGPGEILTP